MSGTTAIVLAGSRPGKDLLAATFGTDLKALVPVAGKPMVCWPVEALLKSARFSQVRVLAQQPERIAAVLPASPKLQVEKSDATIATTIEQLCFDPTVQWPLFVTTADHVLLDVSMIDEFCDLGEPADIAIGVVERAGLMKRLPESKRTWVRFRSGAFSGANMFLLSGRKALPLLELWRSVEQDRKKGWALLWAFGPVNLLGGVLRLRTIHATLDRIGRKFGAKIEAVELSDPLAAVDVDKLSDHHLVETILAEAPTPLLERSQIRRDKENAIPSSTYRFLAWAIENHQPLVGIHNGRPREFSPATLGQSEKGEVAHIWQTGGESSEPLPGWRTFYLQKTGSIELGSGEWKTGGSKGKRQPNFKVDYDANERSPYGPTKTLGDLRGVPLSSVLETA